MLILKIALLLFALFVALDTTLPWYRMFIALAAVILEQLLNDYTEMQRKQRRSDGR